MPSPVDPAVVDAFGRDGAVCLRGVFADWVEVLRAGVARNEAEPGPYVAENVPAGRAGRFWDDYCNWSRISEFRRFAFESDAGSIAAALMGSTRVQLFHDHVLVREPQTDTATPWHSDRPYYLVDGDQTVSFWVPLDPVSVAGGLRVLAGSHRAEHDVEPTRWLTGEPFYGSAPGGGVGYRPPSSVDASIADETVLTWAVEPGDAVAFHFGAVHSAPGNATSQPRRVFSLRLVGDDARVVARPGPTSPPFPGHAMQPGERLRTDWFPILVGSQP